MPSVVTFYEMAKDWLVVSSGLAKDAWHVYFALAIQLAAAQCFRRRLASGWPLVLVLLLELANEWFDHRHYSAVGPDPMAGWSADTARDLFNTLFPPLVVFLIARFRPGRLVAAVAPPASDDVAAD